MFGRQLQEIFNRWLDVFVVHQHVLFFHAFLPFAARSLHSAFSVRIPYQLPASASCNCFSVRPCGSFHSMRPFALRPSTTAAAVLGELKL